MTLLAGMSVVGGSAFVTAPPGGMTLAQLGADVISIDPIKGGLDYRLWPVTAGCLPGWPVDFGPHREVVAGA